MRRSVLPIIAVVALLAQGTLGLSAYGLVLCIGADHAAIESAADDCCASHGTLGSPSVATIERDCCSDIPLYAAARPLSDVPRSHALSTWLVGVLRVVAGGAALDASAEAPRERGVPPSPPSRRRSVVLRV